MQKEITKTYNTPFHIYDEAGIRENIEKAKGLNEKEKAILIASLLYSADKVANTVGHYDAYIKGHKITDQFKFELIQPYKTNVNVEIYPLINNRIS